MPYDYYDNDLPLVGAITSKDIAEEISSNSRFYPAADEQALINVAIEFFEKKHEVEQLSAYVTQFDQVEKLVTRIPKELREYDEVNTTIEPVSITAYTTDIGGSKFGNDDDKIFEHKTTYEPLIKNYTAYLQDWDIKMGGIDSIKPLNGQFDDPWRDIDEFKPKTRNYSADEKNTMVEHVLNGLQSDPRTARNQYVNDKRTLESDLGKLQYQVRKYPDWKKVLSDNKTKYHKYLFEKALCSDVESHIGRLAKKIH